MKWSITNSNPDWKAQAGWFVYAEPPDLVWAYDGQGYLDIKKIVPEGMASFPIEAFSGRVPEEVLTRLPKSLKKRAAGAAK